MSEGNGLRGSDIGPFLLGLLLGWVIHFVMQDLTLRRMFDAKRRVPEKPHGDTGASA